MIDKIMFDKPVIAFGRDAIGLLIYTPNDNQDVTRITGIDKNRHSFNDAVGSFIDIPNDKLDKFRKVFQKIIKGEYDKPDVDNDDLSTEEIGIFTPL